MKKNLFFVMTMVVSLAVSGTVWASMPDSDGESVAEASEIYMPDIDPPERVRAGDFEYYVNSDDKTATMTAYYGDDDVVEIPSEIDGYEVIAIEGEAFSYSRNEGFILPDTLKSIGPRAFEYADMKEIIIPDGATVGTCAFGYNDYLTRVVVGENAVIGNRAFGYCDELKTVVCGNGSKISEDAFEYCRDVEELIACGTVELAEDAFYSNEIMKIVAAGEDEFDEYKEMQDEPVDTGMLSGGWAVTRDSEVTDEAREVFTKAMPSHDMVEYEPVALLATQVVAGTNYCFLRRTTVRNSNELPTYQIVYIWEDASREVHVLEVHDISFGLSRTGTNSKYGPLPAGEYSITLTGDTDVFVDCPASAKAGDIVAVTTVDVADGEVVVEVNGSDSGSWQNWGTYIFVMPEEDVILKGWISTAGYPGA